MQAIAATLPVIDNRHGATDKSMDIVTDNLSRRVVGSVARMAARCAAELEAERERWLLWVPVALGFGIAIYFLMPFEPPQWAGIAALGEFSCVAIAGWRRPAVRIAAVALCLLAAGLCLAQLRTTMVEAPVLQARIGPVSVAGRVQDIDVRDNNFRVLLDSVTIEQRDLKQVPVRVRIRIHGKYPRPEIGSRIRLRAILSPPPAPAMPDAFDFQRQAYFGRLGAVGFGLGSWSQLAPPPENNGWATAVARVRQTVFERVRQGEGGNAGAGIAAALLTGKRGAISEETMAVMRDSGLAHLLAISGLHVGLVAGIIFFAARASLALFAPVALRYPIKKWSAVVALIGAFGYLLISGATVPTQRAFLMTGLVLAAVLFDRLELSMRLVAWAALVVLLMAPESLLNASFQMSFAAVTALIATYEVVRPWSLGRRMRRQGISGIAGRLVVMLSAVALTTVVATLATSPFAAYHFNRLAAYGLLANLVAVPVTGLWIMPWGLAALALMPFGLEAVALEPMGWGIALVLAVARWVSGLPGAVQSVPAMPAVGLALVSLGGLWLCLWHRRWRLYGLVAVLTGVVTVAWQRPPDILVSGDGKLTALRAADGGLWLSSAKSKKFERELWIRRSATKVAGLLPEVGLTSDGNVQCDPFGCIYRSAGRTVAFARDVQALEEDCRHVDAVISTVPILWRVRRGACSGVPTVVGRFDLWRNGAHALWLERDRIRVESVADRRGRRPWVLRPGR